jgi:ABC-2 type transport system ATP-binding protein
MIKVKDLDVRFGRKRVLNDINIEFGKGEFGGIAGNNGVGKSTFLRTLMGIVTPVKGEVVYDKGISKKKIGFISDEFSFFDDFTVNQGIDFHCRVYGIKQFDDKLLLHLDLDRKQRIKALSVGERILFLFSLIMAQEPVVILVDKIIHAIDPYLRELFLEYLLDTIDRFNATVIGVNHSFSEIESIPNRVLIMQNGRFILDEATEALKEKIKKVESNVDIPVDIPVLYKKEVLHYKEYYVYPCSEEMKKSYDYRFQDLNLTEIIKSFIGGYYVKKRDSRGA